MHHHILDDAGILGRTLEPAMHFFSIDALETQLRLYSSDMTLNAIFHRLVDVALAHINTANLCALIGAGFYAATFLMPTMVRLRVFGILSALFFLAYAVLASSIPTFLMYILLLPINSVRLFQILKLVKKARIAVQGDLSIDWLKPFMSIRRYRKGDVLFRKGDSAHEMFLTTTGRFLVCEIGVEIPPGRLMGELGFLAPNNKRTQTVECVEDGAVMTISYDRLLEVYFDHPDLGYYFLRLSGDRLFQNIAHLEDALEECKSKLQGNTAINV
jgi:Cyclic nucleotide-binding domain